MCYIPQHWMSRKACDRRVHSSPRPPPSRPRPLASRPLTLLSWCIHVDSLEKYWENRPWIKKRDIEKSDYRGQQNILSSTAGNFKKIVINYRVTSLIALMSPVSPHPSVSLRHLSTASEAKVNTFSTESAITLTPSSTPTTVSWEYRQEIR